MISGLISRVAEFPAAARYLTLLCRQNALFLERIPTHLRRSEKLKLFQLGRRSAGGNWVEVGSYVGASATVLGLAARTHAPGAVRLFCVDTWLNDAMSEGSRSTFSEFERNTSHLQDLISPLRGQSAQVAHAFSEPVDLLFIDGDHSFDGVSTDIDAWFPKLKSGGTIIFHDIGWAEGVQRAVREKILPIARAVERLPNLLWATK